MSLNIRNRFKINDLLVLVLGIFMQAFSREVPRSSQRLLFGDGDADVHGDRVKPAPAAAFMRAR
jgi:hypothetical protein